MEGIYSPKMLELSDVSHVKVSMTKKATSQFVMFTFLSASKRSQQKTQTVVVLLSHSIFLQQCKLSDIYLGAGVLTKPLWAYKENPCYKFGDSLIYFIWLYFIFRSINCLFSVPYNIFESLMT